MVKEEQTAEVYLGSLRLFKTVSLDSPPKKEDEMRLVICGDLLKSS